jgi:hypothetical protein
VAAAQATSDRWATPDRGPRAAFNEGARAWQLREAASRHAAATWLQCPDRRAQVEEAVSDRWARSQIISNLNLNAEN